MVTGLSARQVTPHAGEHGEYFTEDCRFPPSVARERPVQLIVFFCGKRYKFESDSFRDQRRLTRKMVSSSPQRLASLPSAIRHGNKAGIARDFD
jgi:hypothetical protein